MATAATGVDPTNGLGYIGNNDYRGFLNYLSSNGDTTAGYLIGQGAPNTLGYVDNNGVLNAPLGQQYAAENNADLKAWQTPASTSTNTAAGSGTVPVADSIAALQDANGQDQAQLDSTSAALKNGLTGISDSYNKTLSRANQDQTTAQQNYDQQRQSATQNKLDAQDAIYANGNTLAQSVRRILGMAGGANSSAYMFAAPHAIAQDMTGKTNANAATFAGNMKNIDTAQTDTNTNFARYLQDLADQKNTHTSSLQQGIDQQEQSLYGDMANNRAKIAQLQGGSYLDGKTAAAADIAAAQQRQAAIDALFNQYRNPTTTITPVTPETATTANYTPATSTINNGLTTPVDQTVAASPYSAALKKIFSAA
jgi:hypothetical protein